MLTSAQKIDAIAYRSQGIDPEEIAERVGARIQDIRRYLFSFDLSPNRNHNYKCRPDDPGFEDQLSLTKQQEESQRAAIMWQERMGNESWRGRK